MCTGLFGDVLNLWNASSIYGYYIRELVQVGHPAIQFGGLCGRASSRVRSSLSCGELQVRHYRL